jgi:hypothetical protein
MIPANVMKTWTQNMIATFHSHAKTSQYARDEVGSFWQLPQDSSRSYSMITDAHQICPGCQRYVDALFEK